MITSTYDGLYYSHMTERIFEAIRSGNKFLIVYADDLKPKTKVIEFGSFLLQNELGIYDTIIDYFMEGV